MALSSFQQEQRRKRIGASDISAICGLNPWRTAKDVWVSKVYVLTPEKHSPEAAERGNYLEPSLLDYASAQTGLSIIRNQRRVKGIFTAQHDALAKSAPVGFEAKSTNLSAEWGEPGTDQVPDYVNLQCQQQIYVSDLERVFVPVLTTAFGRLDMRLYKVERNMDVIRRIVKIGEDFWDNHVLAEIPPPDEQPARVELLKRIERVPEKIIELSSLDCIEAWEAAKNRRLGAEKEERQMFARVLEALGDAEAAKLPDGRLLSYCTQNGADRLDRKVLKAKYPDIYSEIATPNSYRVARLKKAS